MSDADNRRHRRESITLLVEYEGADDLFTDVTENLSNGGTFIRTTRELELGTEVKLSLSFPALLEPVRIPGVVRWTRGGAEDDRGVGIEFIGGPDILEKVAELVDRIGAHDPALVGKVCRVLVVEDNPHVARLIREGLAGGTRRAFEDVKFHFLNASNGSEALDKIRSERIDVLVIDIYLPVLDGASVIRQVRANPDTAKLPIIAVSAGGKAAKEEALEAGADFFLAKPMRLREIIESMRRLMPPTTT